MTTFRFFFGLAVEFVAMVVAFAAAFACIYIGGAMMGVLQ